MLQTRESTESKVTTQRERMAFLCCLGRVLIRFRFAARLAYKTVMSLGHNVLRILPAKRPEGPSIRLNESLAAAELWRVRYGEKGLRFRFSGAQKLEAEFPDPVFDATGRRCTKI